MTALSSPIAQRHDPDLLPVPQVRESNDLVVDLAAGEGVTDFTVVAAPYAAMAVDDVVSLDVLITDFEYQLDPIVITLEQEDLGQPLQWLVPATNLSIFKGDQALMTYSITHAKGAGITVSAEQTFALDATAPPPSLEPMFIQGFDGETLNPGDFLNGITLVIPPYEDVRNGDELVLYASNVEYGRATVRTLRADATTVTTQLIEFTLEHAWLDAHSGKQVSFHYQYARAESAATGLPLILNLQKPESLPAPRIDGVTLEGPEGATAGFVITQEMEQGAIVRLPPNTEPEIGPNDVVRLFWSEDIHIEREENGTFKVPATYIPRFIGKRLYVYYEVTYEGQVIPSRSEFFDLWIKEPPVTYWKTLQADNGMPISLAANPDGAGLNLPGWMYMAAGQRLRIKFTGYDGNNNLTDNTRYGQDELVTSTEVSLGLAHAKVAKAFLLRLAPDSAVGIDVRVSFDGGARWIDFLPISTRFVP